MKSKFSKLAILLIAIAFVFGLVACGETPEGGTAEYTVTTSSNLNVTGVNYTKLSAVKKAVGAEVALSATVRDGYSFLGWYEGETLLSEEKDYTFSMPEANKEITAKFGEFKISTNRNNITWGTCTGMSEARTEAGASVNLSANPKKGYLFKGWYDGEELLSADKDYTYIMPKKTVTLTAKFDICTAHPVVNCVCTKCGVEDHSITMDADGYCKHTDGEDTYVYFGYYPQTVKAANVTIRGEADADGYYEGSDSNKYVKAQYKSNSTTDDYFPSGLNAFKDAYYYFKLEPIRWDIVKTGSGKVMLSSSMVLDTYEFLGTQWMDWDGTYYRNAKIGATLASGQRAYANNYQFSDLRKFLTEDFYNLAFSEAQKAMIQPTEVSSSNWDYPASQFGSAPVNDKVYALTVSEINALSNDYRFAQKGMTDYAFLKGASAVVQNGKTCAKYWTRMPAVTAGDSGSNLSHSSQVFDYDYGINRVNVNAKSGVVPVLWIEME